MGFAHGHWKTTALVVGLTLRAMIAPFLLRGAINRGAFEANVDKDLVPEELRPGDTVVMDNLSSHKELKTQVRYEAAGAKQVFLPSYLEPRLQPYRECLRSAQSPPRRAAELRRWDPAHQRNPRRSDYASRMRKCLPRRKI